MFGELFIFCALSAPQAALEKVPEKKTPEKAKLDLRKEPEISGTYVCRGKEPNGKKYKGIAVVTKAGKVYIVTWVIGSASTFTGVGMRQDNSFAVSWSLNKEGVVMKGINLYRIEVDRLVGTWATAPGPGILGTEELILLPELFELLKE